MNDASGLVTFKFALAAAITGAFSLANASLTFVLVAIGGLTPERALIAFAAGADVASAVTDITLNPDPEGRVRDWLRVTA